MDRRIWESVTRGDILTLQEHDPEIIRQAAAPGSLNTVLHLAARFGHLEFVQEIVRTCPDMVSIENAELETCLHEACREGHLEIVKLFLEIDPWLVFKMNCRQESVLFVACQSRKVPVVDHLLNFPMLLMLEVDMPDTSLHVVASSGDTEIAKQILEARPDFARRKNINGCTPLHLACSKGHLDLARELIKLDSDLCLIQDNDGRTGLHCAAAKGRINVIVEILNVSLESARGTTYIGETVLHVAVRNNQYETVRYLIDSLDTGPLLNAQDSDGNTVLHLAAAGKLTAMVVYLLKIGIEVNLLNRKGFTALDVVEADGSNSGLISIAPALLQAGAKRCDQLSPGFMDIKQVVKSIPKDDQMRLISQHDRTPEHGVTSRHNHHRKRAKKMELQNEGLRNARKTVTIVAVLIATVTFTAGLNPPGGFSQETGKALRGDRVAFKTFQVCNILALFLSIGIVNVLVSIIPFRRDTMMKLLTITHKVMWLSTMLMTAAYIAAIWTIIPDHKGSRWLSIEVAVTGGGISVLVFSALGVMLARHWHDKHKWRKAKKKSADESPVSGISRVDELKGKMNQDMSSNSDVESSDHGYHLY